MVERGACIIAKTAYPDLDSAEISKAMDEIAAKVRERLETGLHSSSLSPSSPSSASPSSSAPSSSDPVRSALAALNHVLFIQLSFQGDSERYYDARNSFINDVLKRRLGIPISLAVVYMCVSHRIGLRLTGVNAPGHFLLKTVDEARQDIYIDVFGQGILLDSDGVHDLLQHFQVGRPGQRLDLPQCPPRHLLARMLRNLTVVLQPREALVQGAMLGRPFDSTPSDTYMFVLCLAQLVGIMRSLGNTDVHLYEEQVDMFRWTGRSRILHP